MQEYFVAPCRKRISVVWTGRKFVPDVICLLNRQLPRQEDGERLPRIGLPLRGQGGLAGAGAVRLNARITGHKAKVLSEAD